MKTLNRLIIDIETPGIIRINDRIYPEIDLPKPRRTNPCDSCPNNPMFNPFASGVCSCGLPYMYNPIIS